MENILLSIDHLTKVYPGGKRAVDDLTLHVAAGDIYGFIGQNGAGKTTTLRATAGILPFDAGEIREGALADCLLINMNHPFMVPAYNLVSDLVYAADSACITDVICDGRPVMENGHVDGEEEIVADARQLAEKILSL